MSGPIITKAGELFSAKGMSFQVSEWRGSGPDWMHVHHSDDEAWHVLEGTLVFKFIDGEVEAKAGETVFVPAGVAHGYYAKEGARYLIILTCRLSALIAELHSAPQDQIEVVLNKYDSALVPG